MTGDTVRKVAQIDGQRYIYLRITGFQEKMYFYELYSKKPTFDDCGAADIEPLDAAHIDRERGFPSAVDMQGPVFEIRYRKEGSFSEAELTNIEVTK